MRLCSKKLHYIMTLYTYSVFSYGYATTGNVTTANETLSGITKHKGYSYDSVGRLVSESVGTDVTGYTYDLRGNRLSETQGEAVKTSSYSIANYGPFHTIYGCTFHSHQRGPLHQH